MHDEVIASFLRSKRNAADAGEAVAGYWLVTNRTVTAEPLAAWTAEETVLFHQISFIDDAEIALWKTALEAFARKFGSTDDEILQGRRQLFGTIFENTQGIRATYQVTREDLVRCLGRSPAAKPLLREEQLPSLVEEVSDFDAAIVREPVRRQVMTTYELDNTPRALIVFQGRGGCGKTATLSEWTKELNANTDSRLPLVAVWAAPHLVPNWIQNLVHRWNPALQPVDVDDALERLRIANPGNVPPVLHLGLDGVDDFLTDANTRQNVRELVRYFLRLDRKYRSLGQPPPVRLVITCRNYDTFRRDALGEVRSGGPADPDKEPLLCPFGNFSLNELRRLVRDNFSGLEDKIFGQLPQDSVVAPNLVQVSASSGTLTMTDVWPSSASSRDAWDETPDIVSIQGTTNTRRNYARILDDPMMWRAFCLLEPQQRDDWLDGAEHIDELLGSFYVGRFVDKARERMTLLPEAILSALRRVAAHNISSSLVFRSSEDWIGPCIAEGAMGRDEARGFMAEALAGGIIDDNTSDRWTWRNDFITRHLREGGQVS